ncbi:dephospho-CoA kinase [Kwoniella dendrophila CBS 6074]|uniref:Dephospho-CoA kinase n=1 Tax=Kwoniella dendrophila CBS 6074 TaxID=1295534 RepID=A0AAX4JMV7_9TREE
MLVVGLTGGIASGKSTVSSIFSSQHDIPIIDADLIAREVIEPGTEGYTLVVNHFGKDRIISKNQDGEEILDRAALGEIIFNDSNQRKWLNSIIHPRVRKEIIKKTIKYWLNGYWCVILDIPLLIEAGMWKWVGEIVVIYVNEKLQLSRLISRPSLNGGPGLTEDQAKSRISSQMSLKEKLDYSTFVLDNSGTKKDLELQIERLVLKWKSQQGFGFLGGWWFKLCWFIPPIGLTAGLMVLFTRFLKYNNMMRRRKQRKSKERRKTRGEVDQRFNTREENIELREFNGRPGGRRRTGTSEGSSSILDE